jgi:hypothetical protein
MNDDEFPLDKPELANAAYERFRRNQDVSIVRDLVNSLRLREAEISRKRRISSLRGPG